MIDVSQRTRPDWIPAGSSVARRIRVPLGFLTAAIYLFELWRRAPQSAAVAWSLALVLPGLWLRAYAAGYVKKNRELTVTGPYAHTRNPLYLGSMLIAAGFAVALMSWPVALVLACGFALIYIPVIASEERFLRAAFAGFDDYCRQSPAPDSAAYRGRRFRVRKKTLRAPGSRSRIEGRLLAPALP